MPANPTREASERCAEPDKQLDTAFALKLLDEFKRLNAESKVIYERIYALSVMLKACVTLELLPSTLNVLNDYCRKCNVATVSVWTTPTADTEEGRG